MGSALGNSFSRETGLSEGCLGTKSYPTKVAVPGTEGDGSIESSTENDSLNSPPKRTLRNSVSRETELLEGCLGTKSYPTKVAQPG